METYKGELNYGRATVAEPLWQSHYGRATMAEPLWQSHVTKSIRRWSW